MKKKTPEKEEIWHSNIGILKKIPKSKTKHEFSMRDLIRIPLSLIGFIIPFVYWIDIIWGIVIGIILTVIFEVSGFKQHGGLLEVIETKELLPLHNTGIWEKLNRMLGYSLAILLLVSIFIILTWLKIF